MTTTSLKLPDELKSRVAAAAQRADQSAHAFMLDAIARQVEAVESEAAFVQRALDSLAEVESGGPTYAANDVHAWLLAKARGAAAPLPKPVALERKKRPAAGR